MNLLTGSSIGDKKGMEEAGKVGLENNHRVITLLLHYADVNIMEVYIEINNLQLLLKRNHKNVDFIHVYCRERTDSVQYCPPNAYQDI